MSDPGNNTPANAPGTAKPKSRRWLWVALTVSLSLNLLILGALGGAIWVRRQGGLFGQPGGPGFAEAGRHLINTLPRERRRVIHDIIGRHRGALRPHLRKIWQARRAAADALRAEPFDTERFRQAVETLHRTEGQARRAAEAMTVEIVKTLTADERRQFLNAVIQRRFGTSHRPGPPPGFGPVPPQELGDGPPRRSQ